MLMRRKTAREQWRRAGPLSTRSQTLLDEVQAARSEGRAAGGVWLNFLRSLTPKQQRAVLRMIDEMEDGETVDT
jgi:hypothetical protein